MTVLRQGTVAPSLLLKFLDKELVLKLHPSCASAPPETRPGYNSQQLLPPPAKYPLLQKALTDFTKEVKTGVYICNYGLFCPVLGPCVRYCTMHPICYLNFLIASYSCILYHFPTYSSLTHTAVMLGGRGSFCRLRENYWVVSSVIHMLPEAISNHNKQVPHTNPHQFIFQLG